MLWFSNNICKVKLLAISGRLQRRLFAGPWEYTHYMGSAVKILFSIYLKKKLKWVWIQQKMRRSWKCRILHCLSGPLLDSKLWGNCSSMAVKSNKHMQSIVFYVLNLSEGIFQQFTKSPFLGLLQRNYIMNNLLNLIIPQGQSSLLSTPWLRLFCTVHPESVLCPLSWLLLLNLYLSVHIH